MRLDGFGLFVEDMGKMIRFYRDVLGFEIKEAEDTSNVYLVKDGTLFLLYGRRDFEKMTRRKYAYVKGLNGHSEIALYVDTFDEVDAAFRDAVGKGAEPVLEPEAIYDYIKRYHDIFDLVKIGKLNYHTSDVNWANFAEGVKWHCMYYGVPFYIKESLRKEMRQFGTE